MNPHVVIMALNSCTIDLFSDKVITTEMLLLEGSKEPCSIDNRMTDPGIMRAWGFTVQPALMPQPRAHKYKEHIISGEPALTCMCLDRHEGVYHTRYFKKCGWDTDITHVGKVT